MTVRSKLLLNMQYAELVYLSSIGYYIYAIIVGLLTASTSTAYFLHLIKQSSLLRRLVQQPRLVPIVQSGWVRAVNSNRLVPGDVVVVTTGRVPWDAVLLRGSALTDESTLSGEVW